MGEPIIQIRHANIYQGSNLILQDVNLTVNKGEFVYLVGKTGTGKSSLLKTMYGELPLTEAACHIANNAAGFKSVIIQLMYRSFEEEEIELRKRVLGHRNAEQEKKFIAAIF